MRKLATIRQIKEVIEIPKANNIEIVKVDGWQLIAKKNEFKEGELCCFFEIDSVLPKIEIFDFMKSRKYRVKTAKFMKNISQGLALPITILNEFGVENVTLGQDVTDIIGVKHYEYAKELEKLERESNKKSWLYKLLMRFEFTRKIIQKLNQKSTFPSHIVKKTDEERLQNLGDYDIEKRFINKELEITEKLDGCSMTNIYRPNYLFEEFMVCSRNQYLKKPDNSYWWCATKKENIKNKLRKLHKFLKLGKKDYIIIQGELRHPKIQKNVYKVDDFVFNIFNLKVNSNGKITQYNYKQTQKILCDSKTNILQVPLIKIIKFSSVEELQLEIQKIGNFNSTFNKKIKAEGIVVRDKNYSKNSFKYINPSYLLKHNL